MTGYTKLFGSIIASTIWRESKETKIVWITMLAMSTKEGTVEASIPGLADMARVTIDEVEKALKVLQMPDPYSRSKEHEGRRIKEIDGGWLLFNHAKYRAIRNQEDRREYLRKAQAEHRAKKRGLTVNKRKQMSTLSTHTDTDTDTDTDTPTSGNSRLHGIPSSVEEVIAYGESVRPKISESVCRHFWSHYEGQRRESPNGEIFWITGGERIVTHWREKLKGHRGLDFGSSGKLGASTAADLSELKVRVREAEAAIKANQDAGIAVHQSMLDRLAQAQEALRNAS